MGDAMGNFPDSYPTWEIVSGLYSNKSNLHIG